MKNSIKNILNMIRVVVSVLKKELTTITSIPKLLAAYDKLLLLVGKIEETAQEQIVDTSGLTKDKSETKGKLAKQLAKICNAVMVYAHETENQLLEKEMNYTASSLNKLSDEMLIEMSGFIYNKSSAIQASLKDYGIVAADFTKITTLRDAFRNYSPNVAEARDKRKADTALLSKQVSEARAILRTEIDRLMRVIAEDYPKFYELYKNARSIDDYRGKTKKQNILEGVGIIVGTVSSLFDGSPLESATINILNTEFTETTDEDGFYYFEDVPAGTYTLRIVLDTYKELLIEDVVIQAGDELTVDGSLDAAVESI
jgi:hypothetical protein